LSTRPGADGNNITQVLKELQLLRKEVSSMKKTASTQAPTVTRTPLLIELDGEVYLSDSPGSNAPRTKARALSLRKPVVADMYQPLWDAIRSDAVVAKS
jgi:hypothetical protein